MPIRCVTFLRRTAISGMFWRLRQAWLVRVRAQRGNLLADYPTILERKLRRSALTAGATPDAVQEASLQTNSWDAEDNLGSSILIQVTTKSGSNQFHGTGSLFYTNQ